MVKAAKESATTRPTLIKIGDKWLNVTTWAKLHPGGAAPIERYAGQDGTVRTVLRFAFDFFFFFFADLAFCRMRSWPFTRRRPFSRPRR